jgi:aspartyl-tRNA(Asn)/glutamyl-tRNA(Gln) amidotransferase subunit C
MSIDTTTVRKIARLAGLRVPEEDVESLAGELGAIMSWIDQLAEVDLEGVEPMTVAVGHTLPMRADVVTDGGDAERVLANAPLARDGFFVVPKVVD